MRLPREERAEVVSSLRESGLSIRAIASATGMGKQTVQNELRSGVLTEDTSLSDSEPVAAEQDLPPLPENYMSLNAGDQFREDAQGEWVPEPESMPITGTDGKTYQPRSSASNPPKRKSLVDEFRAAILDLGKAVKKVNKLAEDDRLNRNRETICQAHFSDLNRAIESLQLVAGKFR